MSKIEETQEKTFNPGCFKTASACCAENLFQIAQAKDWLGYLGSPRLASRAQYANGWQIAATEAINFWLKILDGLDDRTIPRFGDEMEKSPPDVLLDKASQKHEAEIERKQDEWLKKKKFK